MALIGISLTDCDDRSAPGGINRVSLALAGSSVFGDFTEANDVISAMTLTDSDFEEYQTEEELITDTGERALETNFVSKRSIVIPFRNVTTAKETALRSLEGCSLIMCSEDNGDKTDQHRNWLWGVHENERVYLTNVANDSGTLMEDKKTIIATFTIRTRNPIYEFSGPFPT